MRQIPVRFDKKTEEKLRANAQEKELKLATYIRRLVEIGLRVEELSEQKGAAKNDMDLIVEALAVHKKWLQKGLVASHEILYLTRYLLTRLPEEKPGEHHQMLDQAQLKAKAVVEGLAD